VNRWFSRRTVARKAWVTQNRAVTTATVRNRRYLEQGENAEIDLPAGDVTEGVVRVGSTVRRPHQPQSFAVGAYLDHLEAVGFDASPRFLGRDEQGRDVLTFIEGRVAGAVLEQWVLSEELLASVAELVRRLHQASAGYDDADEPFPPKFSPAPHPELISHLDVTPQNVVTRGERAIGLVDFDLAGLTTRFIDSYNTAMHWAPLRDPVDVGEDWGSVDSLHRLRVFADAYGWSRDERMRLPRFGAERAARSWSAMKHHAETQGGGWARMWDEGVGELIGRRREWLLCNETRIQEVLVR
jgi:Ser/Thr protein kinase RdoA (MazF antagonist)